MLLLLFVFDFLGCSHFLWIGTEPIALRQQFWGSLLSLYPSVITFTATQDILWSCESKLLSTPRTCYSMCTSKHISPSLFVNQSPKHKEANYWNNNLPLFGWLLTKQIIIEVKIDKCKVIPTRVNRCYFARRWNRLPLNVCREERYEINSPASIEVYWGNFNHSRQWFALMRYNPSRS